MIQFSIPQMSCGHCVRAVTGAVQEIDSQAKVQVDLTTKQVHIESSAERGEIVKALEEAGYAPAK